MRAVLAGTDGGVGVARSAFGLLAGLFCAGEEEEEVVEAVLEVVLADFGPAREYTLTGPALKVAKDVPVLLVPLQILPHLLIAELLLIVDLLSISLPFAQAVGTDLDAASAEVVPLPVVQLALGTALHRMGLDEQEMTNCAVVLGVRRDCSVTALTAVLQVVGAALGTAVLS